ncbi:MAG TPA: queuosine precursor transporter [Anaerolineae bacterium]|nr:queuosine precursor transporter [Anaerolineae bacterium]
MLEQSKTIASLLSVSSYIAAQMLADVASLKIALIPAGPIGSLSIDGGTFIYPLTFTLRDLVHKMLGKRAARVLIVAAAGINLFMAALFGFVSWLPPDPSWALQAEFAAILGPVWRIVIASIIAEVVSELLDTEVYHLWVTRVTTRYQWARVLTSNVVSVPVDSLIFSWIAFGSMLPAGVVWSIFWSNVLVKGAVTLLSLPGIYLVPERGTSS